MSRIVAKRYARALFEVAENRQIIDVVGQELAEIRNTVESSVELQQFLTHPQVSAEEKKSVLEKLFGEKFKQETMHFLSLLVDRRRESVLQDVTEEYIRLANEARGVADATVTSAKPLSDQEKQRLAEKFGQLLNKTLRLENTVDPAIIGGLVIRIGDRLYDGSVAGKLAQFQQSLK